MTSTHCGRLALGLLLVGAVSAYAAPLSDAEITVSDGVILAGRLRADADAVLRSSDSVVIDLRTAAEGIDEESHALWRAGITYINLPTTGAVPTPAQVALFRDILAANRTRSVVVHCQTGNRAGLMWAALRLDAGASTNEAMDEVHGIVTKAPIEQAIRDYAALRGNESSPASPVP